MRGDAIVSRRTAAQRAVRAFAVVWTTSLVLFGFQSPTLATTVEERDVACPVCSRQIRVGEVTSYTTNFRDTDGCPHSAGEEPLFHSIWTCPTCWYSNVQGQFARGVKTATAARIRRNELKPLMPIQPAASQREIAPGVKYDLALQTLEMAGAPAAEVAQVALLGAWAIRLSGTGLAKTLTEQPDWIEAESRWKFLRDDCFAADGYRQDFVRAGTVAARALAAEAGAPASERWRRLVAANVLQAYGEGGLALDSLRGLGGAGSLVDPVARAAAQISEVIAREAQFQRSYIRWAGKALDDGSVTGDEAAATAFRIAECHRRLAQPTEARAASARAIDAGLRPSGLRVVGRALGDVDAAGELSARWKEAWSRGVRTAAQELGAPEISDRATNDLAFVFEPELELAIAKCLDSPTARARRNAATLLESWPWVEPATADALGRRFLDDGDKWVRLAAGDALAALGVEVARAAFVRGLRSRNEEVREASIEALGVLGEADDVPRLLELRSNAGAADELIGPALSALTNQPPMDAATFSTWWNLHQGESREDWVTAGFDGRVSVRRSGSTWTIDDLDGLVGLLADEKVHVRVNALRVLREMSGERFGCRALTSRHDWGSYRQERAWAVLAWRRWASLRREPK